MLHDFRLKECLVTFNLKAISNIRIDIPGHMLVLSTLHNLLSQVLALPNLHTAALFTPTGQLVSASSDPKRSKDDVRVLIGLAGEVWQETKGHDIGMVDSELGRVLVLPVDEEPLCPPVEQEDGESQPLMLLALNATSSVSWEELQNKGRVLASHLAKPLSRYREYLSVPKPPTPISAASALQSPTGPPRD